jgi:hypothetical protein
MAQTQETTPGSGAFGASGFDAVLPLAKEVWGLQLKTAQVFFENTTKLTQTFADFYQTQAAESLKLAQTCFTTGKTVTEEVRRQFTTLAERTTRPS